MPKLTPLIIILTAGTIAACATMDGEENPRGIAYFEDDPRLGEKIDKVCFASQIDGFTNARRDTVVVEKGVRDEYILEVSGVCPDLQNAMRIALDTRTSCLSKFSDLIVSDSFSPSIGNGYANQSRCLIKSIHKWDSRAESEETEETVAEMETE